MDTIGAIERQLFSRNELAERWRVSARTIDRRRAMGLLPWIDLACGRGSRPVVRFSLADIQEFEVSARKDAREGDYEGMCQERAR
jgi:hypothetical protein